MANLAIALIVFGDKGADIALIITVGYVIQVQSAALYIKFSERIFGKAPESTAKDIMEEGVFALHENATMHDAIKMLDEEHIHSVVVLSKNEKPIGLITSDIIINILAEGRKVTEKLGSIKLTPAVLVKESVIRWKQK